MYEIMRTCFFLVLAGLLIASGCGKKQAEKIAVDENDGAELSVLMENVHKAIKKSDEKKQDPITGQELFKVATGVLQWDPEYVLNDMALETYNLALEGWLECNQPDYKRKKEAEKAPKPDMETTSKLMELFYKSTDGNKTKSV